MACASLYTLLKEGHAAPEMLMRHAHNHPLEELAAPMVEFTNEAAAAVTGGVAAGDVTGDDPAAFDATADITSPRDPASGLPTGKRMHKPYVIG